MCAEQYDCQKDMIQSGNDLATTTEYSRDQCAKRCCYDWRCVSFDWNSITHKCQISGSNSPTVSKSANQWYCQKKMGEWWILNEFFQEDNKNSERRCIFFHIFICILLGGPNNLHFTQNYPRSKKSEH